jgi:hypothetical protein
MKPEILKKLNSPEYSIASKALSELLTINSIDKNDLDKILALDNHLIIGDFLEKYNNYQESDLSLIESFINRNLDHHNRLFVSDLIEFATDWGLELHYDKCLMFLIKYGDDDDFVLLSSMDYIFENLKFTKIDEIYRLLNSILQNPESNQSAQVKAAFMLFRITMRKEFLSDLIDLVVNGNENNKLLLGNLLALEYNSAQFFDYYDILVQLTQAGADL